MSETIDVTIYLKTVAPAHSASDYKIFIENGPTPNQQLSGYQQGTFTLQKGGRYYVHGQYKDQARQGGPFTADSSSENVYMNET